MKIFRIKKTIIQSISWTVLGLSFLFFTLKDKKLSVLKKVIQDTKLEWILISGVLLFIVFILRTLRWKVILENLGYNIDNKKVLYSLIIGIFFNSFTPKLGEIKRCISLQEISGIPTSVGFGSVIAERIYDILILVTGLLIVFVLEIERLDFILSEINLKNQLKIPENVYVIISILSLLLVFIIIFSKIIIIKKVISYSKDIILNIRRSFKMKKYGLFLIYTALIWMFLVLMNYTVFLSIPEIENLSIFFAVIVLFVGGVGWAFPTPAGIGTTHFLMLQLFIAYGLGEENGIVFGVVSNGIVFIFTLLYGSIAIGTKNLFIN
ncbi:lysylphosphatidylglycerol synthase transmembrane domain-containing protein [uncultured Aquimarina sp.]|uniref:lysylphosphatidylglycerol synthase transmembrane domain-containing protein n=1 Tax=uncultured Aquimarina sp. TaxID=575652 RepID=UPI0026174F40|nr:lysylphosphatidylglycerol synthase transmembrane domain-containing protein [uncultured Aquimarina sp.]